MPSYFQLIQLKHEFAFGSAVSAHEITYGDSRYKDFVFKYFNWATLENALKWDFMERNRVSSENVRLKWKLGEKNGVYFTIYTQVLRGDQFWSGLRSKVFVESNTPLARVGLWTKSWKPSELGLVSINWWTEKKN